MGLPLGLRAAYSCTYACSHARGYVLLCELPSEPTPKCKLTRAYKLAHTTRKDTQVHAPALAVARIDVQQCVLMALRWLRIETAPVIHFVEFDAQILENLCW